LISLLLPALRKARESAKQLQCLSNMRQLAAATINFTAEHRGQMPGNGGYTLYKFDMAGIYIVQVAGDSDTGIIDAADWIRWQRKLDYVTNTTSNTPVQNITFSGLTRYLGHRVFSQSPTVYSVANETLANNVDSSLDSLYRCPSDNVEQRLSPADSSHGYYRYSYAMNLAYANPVKAFSGHPATALGAPRVDGLFNGRITSIKNAAEKVLFICADEKTVSSGSFTPDATGWAAGNVVGQVSARHMLQNIRSSSNLHTTAGNQDGKGNVVFCDGHGEYFGRKDSLRARFSGNPIPDPKGF
jgi:prepilin-type processing-associated H-X9-DG protein